MSLLKKLLITILLLVADSSVGQADDNRGQITIRIPQAKPDHPETYLCTSLKLETEQTLYITGFEPLADRKTAHHMILFGCKTPGKFDPLYNCGAMAVKQKGLASSTEPCGLGSSIMYAWAQNAPKFHLPKDVAFRVGGDTGIDWIVLQVRPQEPSGYSDKLVLRTFQHCT